MYKVTVRDLEPGLFESHAGALAYIMANLDGMQTTDFYYRRCDQMIDWGVPGSDLVEIGATIAHDSPNTTYEEKMRNVEATMAQEYIEYALDAMDSDGEDWSEEDVTVEWIDEDEDDEED